MPLENIQELLGQPTSGLMKLFAHFDTSSFSSIIHFYILEKPLGHDGKGIVRPALEPVNSATVDEGRELSETVPESVSYRTHGEYDMELVSNTVYKQVEQGQGSAISLLGPFSLPTYCIWRSDVLYLNAYYSI